MCCRYYMEMSPELRPIIEEANRSALKERIPHLLSTHDMPYSPGADNSQVHLYKFSEKKFSSVPSLSVLFQNYII